MHLVYTAQYHFPLLCVPVSSQWGTENPRYHHLNTVTSSPLSGRASTSGMELGRVWGVAGRAGCPSRSGSGVFLPRAVAGPGTAGAAEVHGDGRLLELWYLGFWVHHGLPAFSPQLAACAVVSERPRPGVGDWESLLKEGVCPFVFVVSLHLFPSHWVLPGWAWAIWGLSSREQVLLGPSM